MDTDHQIPARDGRTGEPARENADPTKGNAAGGEPAAPGGQSKANGHGNYTAPPDPWRAVSDFAAAIAAAGLGTPTIEPDGKIHRFQVEGDTAGSKNGWYSLHLDGIAAGIFGSWKWSEPQTWCSVSRDQMTPAQSADLRRMVETAKAEREAEDAARHAKAAEDAAALWERAKPARPAHPYLVAKGIEPHGIRQDGPRLVVPVYIDGQLASVQTIDPARTPPKLFLKDGRIAGGCFVIETAVTRPEVLLCEGFATGATLHEQTGAKVYCAFSSGNLAAVARTVRALHTGETIIVCADNDAWTPGNPGMTAARAAALVIGARLLVPGFTGMDLTSKPTDFNDLARLAGGLPAGLLDLATDPNPDNGPPPPEPGDPGPGADPDKTKRPTGVTLIRADGIKPERINWVWVGWLARGKVHVMAGAPGTGKTTAAVALAATLTVGGRWPDGIPAPVGDVLVWSGEDDPKDTLVPRLIAAGADLKRVHFVASFTDERGPRAFDPASDIGALADHLATMDPAPVLLIVDPIVSAIAGDSHKNAEVRRSLQPLVDLAQLRGVAVLGISHFSKGTQGRDPTERVTGSLAFGALARVVLATAKLPDEQGGGRILVRAKSNLGPDSGGFGYDLEQTELDEHPGIITTRVLWGEVLEGTARELLSQADTQAGEDDEGDSPADVEAFIFCCLKDGPATAKQMQADTNGAGYSWDRVKRTAGRMGVERKKEGFKGGWLWSLRRMQDTPEECEGSEGSTPTVLRSSRSSLHSSENDRTGRTEGSTEGSEEPNSATVHSSHSSHSSSDPADEQAEVF